CCEVAGADDYVRLEVVDRGDRTLEEVGQEKVRPAVQIRDLDDGERAVARRCHGRSLGGEGSSGPAATLSSGDAGNPAFPGISGARTPALRQQGGARVREGTRLLR